jgi:hypothetical protein
LINEEKGRGEEGGREEEEKERARARARARASGETMDRRVYAAMECWASFRHFHV